MSRSPRAIRLSVQDEVTHELERISAELTLAFYPMLYKIDAQQLRIPQHAQSYDESDKPVRFYARQDEEDLWTYGGRFYPDESAIILPMGNEMARFAKWIAEQEKEGRC